MDYMKYNKLIICTLFLIIITLTNNVFAFENDFAEGSVYFENQKATVYDAELKIGEPATILAEVHLNKNIDVSAGITATGFADNAENQPFEVIEGPSEFTETAREFGHNAGDTVTFEWIVKPTEIASGWTVPLNIDFTFYDRDEKKGYPIEFTVANIQISNEHYSGSTPKPTPDSKSTDQPPSSEGSPGFGVVAALMGLAAVVLITKK